MRMVRLAALAVLVTGPGVAAPLDGSQQMICATTEVFACDTESRCERETVTSVDVPQFLRVSPQEKTVTGTRPSGEAVDAKIETMRRAKGRIFVQGVVNDLGWTMNIAEESGRMTLVAAEEDSGYVIFGACTVR